MSFSYSPSSTPSDLTRVRFHTGQTVSDESFLSDEEISMMLAEEGTWPSAVIAGLKFIIMKLSKEDFSADWLKVSHAEARKGYQVMLAEKRRELGLPAVTGRGQAVFRGDSLMTEVPSEWQD